MEWRTLGRNNTNRQQKEGIGMVKIRPEKQRVMKALGGGAAAANGQERHNSTHRSIIQRD